jgi:hypothetical protein
MAQTRRPVETLSALAGHAVTQNLLDSNMGDRPGHTLQVDC